MIEKLKNLIEVKKIIALTVVFVFCTMAIMDKVDVMAFTNVVTLVIGYYYGQSSTRQAITENKGE